MIFVSYASKDQKHADRVVSGLEAAGLTCWISSRDMKLGADYQSSIVNAVTGADVLMLLLSHAANESLEVPKELALAGKQRKQVIPVRIENVEPAGALAYQITNAQWIDLFRNFDTQMDALCVQLGATLTRRTKDTLGEKQRARRRAIRLGLIASAAVLVLAAGAGVLAYRSVPLPWALEPPPKPIPPARPGHLTIGVTHLDGDTNREFENLLVNELASDVEGADVTPIDRDMTWPEAPSATQALEKAKLRGATLRTEADADVLLWGRIVTVQGHSAMLLYWTTAQPLSGVKGSRVYQPETLELPALFWNDLKQVLGLLLQSRLALVREQMTGHYAADKIAPLITQFRGLLRSQQGSWNPETDARVRATFADALQSYADQTNDLAALREAADCYRKVLTELPRADAPLDWARNEHSLGSALLMLGQQESGTDSFRGAITAYEAALQERTRARAPLDWAQTQNGLASALEYLGEREPGAAGINDLQQSLIATHHSLEIRTRARFPDEWATLQNNLALTLTALGERETSAEAATQSLRDAVTALQHALEVRTRSHAPFDWADTQNNLADAYDALGVRLGSADTLRLGAAAAQAALEEWKHDKTPLYWAFAQNNLGKALRDLGELTANPATIEQASQAFTAALSVFTPDTDPDDWADTKFALGDMLRQSADRLHGAESLRAAIDALTDALTQRDRKTAPDAWTATQQSLGLALAALGQANHDAAMQADSRTHLAEAIDGFRVSGDTAAAARLQVLLGPPTQGRRH
jgi:tetratricopeptide (TPR) repeat protein